MDGHLRLPQSPMEADTGETGDSLFVNSLARRPWFGGWQLASSATDRHPTQAISSIVRRKSNLFPITLADFDSRCFWFGRTSETHLHMLLPCPAS